MDINWYIVDLQYIRLEYSLYSLARENTDGNTLINHLV